MNENTYRRFQAIMRVVTTIGAVIVFFSGIHRFHIEQERLFVARIEAEQLVRDREFRRELWLRQLDILSSIASASSRIAASVGSNPDDYEVAVQEYEALYWGKITFVDDTDLVAKMDTLRHEIRIFGEGLVPSDGLSAADKVKQRAYGVAIACRISIEETGQAFLEL